MYTLLYRPFFSLLFKICFALFLTFLPYSLLDIRASCFLILNFDTLGGGAFAHEDAGRCLNDFLDVLPRWLGLVDLHNCLRPTWLSSSWVVLVPAHSEIYIFSSLFSPPLTISSLPIFTLYANHHHRRTHTLRHLFLPTIKREGMAPT